MKHTISMMTSEGDRSAEWEPDNKAQVAAARAIFDAAKKAGHMVYSVTPGVAGGTVVHEFDPNAQSLVARPAIAAG